MIEDGELFEPTENPFIHGCCDCGLAHRIEYLIDDGALSLRFSRDHEATKLLQMRLGAMREASRQIVSDGLRELASELTDGVRITKDAAIRLLLEAADLLTVRPPRAPAQTQEERADCPACAALQQWLGLKGTCVAHRVEAQPSSETPAKETR
jgi:hypothetical protein